MLDLQIEPMTSAHNDGSYAHLCDYANKSDRYCIHCGCSAGCILFRLSGVCIYQIQPNCRCVVGGSDSSECREDWDQ